MFSEITFCLPAGGGESDTKTADLDGFTSRFMRDVWVRQLSV